MNLLVLHEAQCDRFSLEYNNYSQKDKFTLQCSAFLTFLKVFADVN